RREGRALVVEPLRENALARAVRLENADRKLPVGLAGEGDVIAARRPHRRRVMALAEADALRRAAAGRHHINLLRTAAIALEADLAVVRRVARRGIDGRRVGQPRRL